MQTIYHVTPPEFRKYGVNAPEVRKVPVIAGYTKKSSPNLMFGELSLI